MNKTELVDAVASISKLSKADSKKALDAVVEAVTKSLKKGDSVQLIGFGTFKVSTRKARDGRNPQTGETIKIKAHKVPTFSAGKVLKDAVNKKKK
jgi:nucleoid DNA-binding protein